MNSFPGNWQDVVLTIWFLAPVSYFVLVHLICSGTSGKLYLPPVSWIHGAQKEMSLMELNI